MRIIQSLRGNKSVKITITQKKNPPIPSQVINNDRYLCISFATQFPLIGGFLTCPDFALLKILNKLE